MKTVKVNASKEYDIYIGRNLSEFAAKKIKNLFGNARVCLVTDSRVFKIHSEKIISAFEKEKINCELYVFPMGEESKSEIILFDLLNFLAENHFSRNDVLVALGGGVTGDLTGLAAALYMRGMHLVQLPTTLLAAVDSSVGGKTAVNLEAGKNLVGVFNQPELVVCDCELLKTLPKEIFADGMAEVIKYGVIADKELFEKTSVNFSENDLEDIITRCVEIKRDIVNEDERDTGKRQLLNFGHTLAHAIEKTSDFSVSHGSAVAMGMVLISELSEQNGLSDELCKEKIIAALTNNGLPVKCDFSKEELWKYVISDKKISGENISLILPKKIGECYIKKISLNKLEKMMKESD